MTEGCEAAPDPTVMLVLEHRASIRDRRIKSDDDGKGEPHDDEGCEAAPYPTVMLVLDTSI